MDELAKAPVLAQCAACRSPFAEQITERMRRGSPDTQISKWLKDNDAYISRITLGMHKREHLTDEFQTAKKRAVTAFKKQQGMIDRRVEKSADRDLAVSLASILGGGPIIEMIEMHAEEITDGKDASLDA
jgi:predicted aldo/keto reductase-like oxidoreductase